MHLFRRFAIGSLALALLLVAGSGLQPRSAQAQGDAWTGWAVNAYPQYSNAEFRALFQRQRDNGANFVWFGHNNPVAVDPDAWEVALSWATYEAWRDPADPRHENALYIVDGQKRALAAARATGMQVVLPIGYRTQMGQVWSDAHPDELRRDAEGVKIVTDGADASPYSAIFRRDNEEFYRWVHREFVQPYRDTLLMVMLSNEPTGVDYSAPANAEFQRRHGFRFEEVGNDFERAAILGKFQAHVMVDYAKWGAEQWLALDPDVTVTIAFDGGVGRTNMQAPVVEATFRDMPPNFQPAWDIQIRNGGPGDALNDADITGFAVLAGTLAQYSRQYQRPFWAWTAGNSWGLGTASSDPSNIADAQVNMRALANIARQSNGYLRGIAVWAYNVRAQGLYFDQYRPPYDADTMFTRLTRTMPAVREILLGPAGNGTQAFVVAPNGMAWRQMGEGRVAKIHSYRSYNFGDLVSLARTGMPMAVVDNLEGVDLSAARMIVVLAREGRDVGDPTSEKIRAFRAGGGVVVSTDEMSGVKGYEAQWRWDGPAPELFFTDRYTVDRIGPPESLGFPRLHNSFVFTGPLEYVVYGGTSRDAADEMRAWIDLPFGGIGTVYGVNGTVTGEVGIEPGKSPVPTRRHAYVLVPR